MMKNIGDGVMNRYCRYSRSVRYYIWSTRALLHLHRFRITYLFSICVISQWRSGRIRCLIMCIKRNNVDVQCICPKCIYMILWVWCTDMYLIKRRKSVIEFCKINWNSSHCLSRSLACSTEKLRVLSLITATLLRISSSFSICWSYIAWRLLVNWSYFFAWRFPYTHVYIVFITWNRKIIDVLTMML